MTGRSGQTANARVPSASEVLWLALVFGLGTGLLEVAVRAVQKYALGGHLFVTRDLVWMAPLTDAALFLVAGVVLLAMRGALGAIRPGQPHVGYAAVFATYVTMIPLGPLLTTTRIHTVAAVLLSLGIGVQGGRMLARRAEGVRRLARKAAPAFIVLVGLGLLVVRGGQWLQERRMTAALPVAALDAPNVLLIILDTVRSADLSLYGYEKPTTPTLERLASGGVTFDRALATSPWTLPSHATMFTGRYPHELTADWLTPLDDADPTLAEHFGANGYRTAGFIGNLIYATWETGLNRGFSRYEDFPTSLATAVSTSWLARWLANRLRPLVGADDYLVSRSAADINEDFLAWLDRGSLPTGSSGRTGESRPFFAFLNYMEAHGPYLPPDSLAGRFGPVRTGRALADLSVRREWPAEELAAERAAYNGEIALADQQIGNLVSELESRGVLDNTLIVVTSDHGEQFGEHGLTDHANSLYGQLLDVPLVFVMPGRLPAGLRVDEPVSLRDMAATIADLATGSADEFPGRSLLGLVKSESESPGLSPIIASVSGGVRMPEWVPVSRGDMHSLLSGGYHYIIDGDGSEELYHFALDRDEVTDLAGAAEQAERLAEMRRALQKLLSAETGAEVSGAEVSGAGIGSGSVTSDDSR